VSEDVNAGDFDDWIGVESQSVDVLTPRLLESWQATLDYPGLDLGDVALGVQWCLGPQVALNRDLSEDGHPVKGKFLPPIPLPRRMWAGSDVRFYDGFRPGEVVTHRSSIDSVERKTGRSGVLWFVAVRHSWSTSRGLAIEERQDIVYRGASKAGASGPGRPPAGPVEQGRHVLELSCTPMSLFRFSAVTFNSHRIHYDLPYATGEEAYPGLVIHGPLQASMLLNFARQIRDGGRPDRFRFRGVAPLILGRPFHLHAGSPGADEFDLWITDADGVRTMSATAGWRASA